MGYEVRLRIGWLGHPSREVKRSTEYKVEESGETAYVWYPSEKKANGDLIFTERMERHFFTVAMVDLCKIGSGPLSRLLSQNTIRNKNPKTVIKWFNGPESDCEKDAYGDRFKPVRLNAVIKALKEELKGEPYNRFAYALALCEAVEADNTRNCIVLFEGH